MAADGFVLLCGRSPAGEGFVILTEQSSRFDGFRKLPTDAEWMKKTTSPVVGQNYWVSGSLQEPEARATLARAGLSDDEVESKLEWSREWVTTISWPPESKPNLWWVPVPSK
jgi:hypothetical protein